MLAELLLALAQDTDVCVDPIPEGATLSRAAISCGTWEPAEYGVVVAYSCRLKDGRVNNNSQMRIFRLRRSRILITVGYGNHPVAAQSAVSDALLIREAATAPRSEGGLEVTWEGVKVHLWVSHGHLDHINSATLRVLEDELGATIAGIHYHVRERALVSNQLSRWKDKFDEIDTGPVCQTYQRSNNVHFLWRPGHTNGSMDLLWRRRDGTMAWFLGSWDVPKQGDPGKQKYWLPGSNTNGTPDGVCIPPGVATVHAAHGDVRPQPPR